MRAYSVGCARRRRLWGSTMARSWAGCSGSGRTSSPGSAPTESSATVLRVPDVLGVTFLGRFGPAERSRPRLTLWGCTPDGRAAVSTHGADPGTRENTANV